MAAVGVLYNKTLFGTLHLAVPRTLADFNAVCARVKRAGLTPIGLGNADGWVGDDLYLTLANALAGPSSLTPELSLSPSFSFKGAPFRQAAQTLQSWSRNNYFTREFGGLDAQDAVEAFFAGRTAMQLVSSSGELCRDRRGSRAAPFPTARRKLYADRDDHGPRDHDSASHP